MGAGEVLELSSPSGELFLFQQISYKQERRWLQGLGGLSDCDCRAGCCGSHPSVPCGFADNLLSLFRALVEQSPRSAHQLLRGDLALLRMQPHITHSKACPDVVPRAFSSVVQSALQVGWLVPWPNRLGDFSMKQGDLSLMEEKGRSSLLSPSV